MARASIPLPPLLVLATVLAIAGCSARGENDGRKRGDAKAAAEAGYVELHSEAVPLRLELPGRTTAFETSEVRPQVSGIIQARLFTEGAVVKAGDVLYRIDPRLYESALSQARADLASAIATRDAGRMRADRTAELAKAEVVSKQDLLDAQSAAEAASAGAERARAGVQSAEINLQFTKVSAPISGRIGRSVVTTGALVSASQAVPLATIQRLDPIFVDIQQSSGALLSFRRQVAGGDLARASTDVTLKLEDGSQYAHKGVLEFAESVVDPSTGTVTVRARFPNPEGWLLPGMYVRAEFSPVQAQSAILVPQQGISRDSKGNATVLVIDGDSKAQLRTITAERTVGDRWMVSKGLSDGDRVIVEGLGRIQPGQAVKPVAVTPPQGMISRTFIDRPVLAWVISILIMLGGVAGIALLPVEQYPDIAPPSVNIRASYPGASAETLESSVTQVIEQQLTGIDGLIYFSSNSNAAGVSQISVTFERGTNADFAQVQVQNKVQQALPRLPQAVQQQGLVVTKSNPDFLLVLAVYDETDKSDAGDISDFMVSNMQDAIGRIEGVGDFNVFGAQYAMRIWLDPVRLASFQLMPRDVTAAIQAQNTQVAAGQLGAQPTDPSQMLNATVTARSRLTSTDQFRRIIVKTQPDGSMVRLSDVARVELGSESYNNIARLNGHPASGMSVQLAPGADALRTAELVRAEVERQSKHFPPGYKFAFPQDSTDFVRLSIEEVVWTLIEAIILVVIVMFVFLQSWRATLIPAIAVPVVLLGTFGVLSAAGFTINTLTLFGMVLAIGLLVDDAIVVVENVERVMREEPGITAREATIKSMDEIQTALIAIALVLSAVFLPMAFFGGSVGQIYRQFSITMVAAMALSVVVALVLTPALTAILLKPPSAELEARRTAVTRAMHRLGDRFSTGFDSLADRYRDSVRRVLDHAWWTLGVYAVLVAALVAVFLHLPTSFLPVEDQGRAQLQYTLPPGATMPRTMAAVHEIEQYFLTEETKDVPIVFAIVGQSQAGAGQNAGRGFIALAPWDERKGAQHSAAAITQRATAKVGAKLRDAEFFALNPPPVRGLGQSSGFTMELLNSGSLSRDEFKAARDKLLDLARGDPMLTSVRSNTLEDTPTLSVDIDQEKAGALGLTQADVDSTLSAAWGGNYVNDFIDRGRVKRVYMQGDSQFRSRPEDLGDWYVRTSTGTMTPFSAFASTSWARSPVTLSRYNGLTSYEIQGSAAQGRSTGDSMNRMEELARQIPGTSIDWSGLSYQERRSSGQAPLLYAISLLVVFLCLAALYESWSIPVSVLMVVPLGLLGAALAVWMRGLSNDVYFQVGLLTTMGLAAKNAILIVEFAEAAEKLGKSARDAALEAARLRLRPIVMTSLAFIFGVLPLAVSNGAGAQSRIAIGTAVIGGMITGTVLAVLFVPLFFVLIRRIGGRAHKKVDQTRPIES